MKTDLLKIRVSDAEKEAFQAAATIAGITVSAWARERLRRAAVRDLQDASRPIPFLEKSNAGR
jgi:outer membrane receptor for ferrienterochelin and colicin